MRVSQIQVKGFRLLQDVRIDLDPDVTFIVGRNNSGKTSFVEVVDRFMREKSKFSLEDFSIPLWGKFDEAQLLARKVSEIKSQRDFDPVELEKKETELKATLPQIELTLYIEYSAEEDLAPISKFILDLDENRRHAVIRMTYAMQNPLEFFSEFDSAKTPEVLDYARKRVRDAYVASYSAIDVEDETNSVDLDRSEVLRAITPDFIWAQNRLDDQGADSTRRLSDVFADHYTAFAEASPATDIDALEKSLSGFGADLEGQYQDIFSPIFRDLRSVFGVGADMSLPELKVSAVFDPSKVMRSNARLKYVESGASSHQLPESHNGLGFSKLIYMALTIVKFHRVYMNSEVKPAMGLVFIEEPESHLHPQLQEVFIRRIRDFINRQPGWNPQIIITTHSPHITIESNFEPIRYVKRLARDTVEVRDLSQFEGEFESEATPDAEATEAESESEQDDVAVSRSDQLKFLRQYMTLRPCDLLFADKAILVEGTTERLLLPKMIDKVFPDKDGLQAQYVSTIEVGGRHAQVFRALLGFLGIPTLIITDIDSISTQTRKKCPTEQPGAKTSNTILKDWIPGLAIVAELIKCGDEKKTDGACRVAYQVPETGNLRFGRSFEEAFVIANAGLLHAEAANIPSCKRIGRRSSPEILIAEAYEVVKGVTKKSDFAFELLGLADEEYWTVPRYIKEGLEWLKTTPSNS